MDKKPHPNHDRGLEFDLQTMVSRRKTLGLFLGAGAVATLATTSGSAAGGFTAALNVTI